MSNFNKKNAMCDKHCVSHVNTRVSQPFINLGLYENKYM